MKDLFETPETLPIELKKILDKYESKLINGLHYDEVAALHHEVLAIGYTFDSGLDACPFGLRTLGTELNELEGYEDF
jgi:hypothetical protein